MSNEIPSLRRALAGTAAALATLAGLGAVMFALRSHLSLATVAVVLVIPVVVGVVAGGLVGGGVAVVAGFVVYDLGFVPPYGNLSVQQGDNWVALVVYVVVAALVARVVGHLWESEAIARRQRADAGRIFEISELLVGERPLAELLELIVSSVRDAFDLDAAVLLLPSGGELRQVASAGRVLTDSEVGLLTPGGGVPSSLAVSPAAGKAGRAPSTRSLVLAVASRPIGVLGIVGRSPSRHENELLATFANHIAVALERAQLREETLRVGVLEEADRLRRALTGAVSHDLRTPLATIKASTSALLDPAAPVPVAEQAELLRLVEAQADRLSRLVSNLLDMSRIQSGMLVLRRSPIDVHELVDEALAALGPAAASRVRVAVPPALPLVHADHVVLSEVLVNLLENAIRFAPEPSLVEVEASTSPDFLVVTVTDRGPGVPMADRDGIFDRPRRATAGTGGGSGLGLTIVKSFVEAHGGRVFVEDAVGGGARFGFELPWSPDAGPSEARSEPERSAGAS